MAEETYPKVYLYRRIVQSKLFIDQNSGEDLNLDNIASEAYFSKFHFIRLFKKVYGKTPHQYLISVRIEKAKELLKTKIPVSETCHLVGFESISSFTNLFKRVVGQNPASYQTNQLLRQDEIIKAPLRYIPSCFAKKYGWDIL